MSIIIVLVSTVESRLGVYSCWTTVHVMSTLAFIRAGTRTSTTLIMLMWSTSTARLIHQRRTTTTARCVWSHLATLGSRWCRVGINDFAQRVPTACVSAWRGTRMSYLPNGHISFVLNLYWSDWTVQLFELFWLDWTVSLMELNCFCIWPVVNVLLDARERSSCTSSYWYPAFPHLRFHRKSPEPALVWGPFWPKADYTVPSPLIFHFNHCIRPVGLVHW